LPLTFALLEWRDLYSSSLPALLLLVVVVTGSLL
jgi:hypothetical protein